MEDSFLHTGDDAVAGFDNCGMVVRGCDISSACSAFRIGGRDILIEDCNAHGPCEYVFRGSLSQQARRDGLWDPATVPGRHSMATFFLYLCDYTMPVRHQPGNILVRNCTVENAARLVRFVRLSFACNPDKTTWLDEIWIFGRLPREADNVGNISDGQ